MKVYVLIERIYNYDSGEENTSFIDGVYATKEKAIEEMTKEIQNNIENFGFIEDTDNALYTDRKTLFWSYQENWNNYIELEIIESEVQ